MMGRLLVVLALCLLSTACTPQMQRRFNAGMSPSKACPDKVVIEDGVEYCVWTDNQGRTVRWRKPF